MAGGGKATMIGHGDETGPAFIIRKRHQITFICETIGFNISYFRNDNKRYRGFNR